MRYPASPLPEEPLAEPILVRCPERACAGAEKTYNFVDLSIHLVDDHDLGPATSAELARQSTERAAPKPAAPRPAPAPKPEPKEEPMKKPKKPHICGKCAQPGHRAPQCPDARGPRAPAPAPSPPKDKSRYGDTIALLQGAIDACAVCATAREAIRALEKLG